jgi:hypothetical protein
MPGSVSSPANTPPVVQDKLESALAKIVADVAVQQKLATL